MNNTANYWFTIEPYVYVNIVDKYALLYNTLDGTTIESKKTAVITLLNEMLQEENCGVVLLKDKQYKQVDIINFILELREKFMGDIIDINLSKEKPIQVLPYINYSNKRNKKCNFFELDNLLQSLFEINIHIDKTSNIENIITYIQTIPSNAIFNIIKSIDDNTDISNLLIFLDKLSSLKNIICSYTHIPFLEKKFKNNFSYKIYVNFPINKELWDKSILLIQNQHLSFKYIFNVTSISNVLEAEEYIENFHINNYQLNPQYTGNNITFFRKYIFLTKEDILSTYSSLKDIFIKHLINEHDFGKIHIMPNGDIYANTNFPMLGNLSTHNIYEIVQKEIQEGQSWLRTRKQEPCNSCIYQYLCPSPSDYEIIIGRLNLCHIK